MVFDYSFTPDNLRFLGVSGGFLKGLLLEDPKHLTKYLRHLTNIFTKTYLFNSLKKY